MKRVIRFALSALFAGLAMSASAEPLPPTEILHARLHILDFVNEPRRVDEIAGQDVWMRNVRRDILYTPGDAPLLVATGNPARPWQFAGNGRVIHVAYPIERTILKAVYGTPGRPARAALLASMDVPFGRADISVTEGPSPVRLVVRKHSGDHPNISGDHYDLIGPYPPLQ